ncbi:MAG: acyl carrier protein [Dehalococcoidia bacterium]
MPSVEETVKQIVMRIVRKPDLDFSPTSTFKDFDADSLDIVQILVAVEDHYDIEIDDEELQEITDMGGFINYIENKIAEKG